MRTAHFILTASKKIGMGHWMRCIELSKVFEEKKILSTFHTWGEAIPNNNLPANVSVFRYSAPHEVIAKASAKSSPGDLVIIDTDEPFFLTEDSQQKLKSAFASVAYFTINTTAFFSCDYIISYNVTSYLLKYQTSAITKVLAGLKYTIFRDEFRNLPENRSIKNVKPRAFVSFGGSDPLNATGMVIEQISQFADSFESIEVVSGPLSSDFPLSDRADNINHHKGVGNISEIMQGCDIGFCGTGGTFYELSLLRIPCWIVASSLRELPAYHYLQEKKMAFGLGDFSNGIEAETIKHAIASYLKNGTVPQNHQQVSDQLDKNGVYNIVENLLSSDTNR
jgi:spore coat polysaccharide biosynthesis predicted glycosyltransferase SpsG